MVVAPSGPVHEAALARGCAALGSLGLSVEVAPHALDRAAPVGYLAGADAHRAADLQAAWCDPDVAAVVCARGGYGALRLVDHLDWAAMAAAGQTVLVGSSDVTALHLAVAARLGLGSYFGPMPAGDLLGGESGFDKTTLDALGSALFDTAEPLLLRAEPPVTVTPGRAEGVITGGTLSLLAAALGSGDLPPASGGIVLLEDVAEAPYRVDRMLTSLLRAGYFSGVAAVMLGSWERCDPEPGRPHEPRVRDVLAERLGPLGLPVLAGLPVGHGRPQLTVPLGARAVLDADAGTVRVLPS